MKKILNSILLTLSIITLFYACQKVEPLGYFQSSNKSNLTVSSSNVMPTTRDSANTVLTVNWTNAFSTNETAPIKYTIQIDSLGGIFSSTVFSKSFSGVLSGSFLAKELNNLALRWGYDFYSLVGMKMRVISSYANNNNASSSDPINFIYKIYPVPVIPLPSSGNLYIVGSATASGWNNPVPDTNRLTRIDSFTYQGTFPLSGGNQYVLLPVNGSWTNKYSVRDNTIPGLSAGGSFGYNLSGNIPGPNRTGLYQLTFDFLRGKFRVNLVRYLSSPVQKPVLNQLFLVGNATAGGWSNPVPSISQQLTSTSNDTTTFNGVFYMNGAKEYLLLPRNGSWDNKYGVSNTNLSGLSAGGQLVYNPTGNSTNIPAPATSGTYRIEVDCILGLFTVTNLKTYKFLYVPGSYQATPWTPASAPQLASPNNDGNYEGYVYFSNAADFKITSQNDWNGTSYGKGADSTIVSSSGGNLSVPRAGLYLLKINTSTLRYSATLINSFSMIGDFNNWNADATMTYNSATNEFTGSLTLAAGQAFKFRANNAWDINIGFSKEPANFGKSLNYGGDNISLPAKTYTVTLSLGTAGYYYFDAK